MTTAYLMIALVGVGHVILAIALAVPWLLERLRDARLRRARRHLAATGATRHADHRVRLAKLGAKQRFDARPAQGDGPCRLDERRGEP